MSKRGSRSKENTSGSNKINEKLKENRGSHHEWSIIRELLIVIRRPLKSRLNSRRRYHRLSFGFYHNCSLIIELCCSTPFIIFFILDRNIDTVIIVCITFFRDRNPLRWTNGRICTEFLIMMERPKRCQIIDWKSKRLNLWTKTTGIKQNKSDSCPEIFAIFGLNDSTHVSNLIIPDTLFEHHPSRYTFRVLERFGPQPCSPLTRSFTSFKSPILQDYGNTGGTSNTTSRQPVKSEVSDWGKEF